MYPLKYAIKKIYKGTGNFNYYSEQEQELYSYEASKCYLAAEHKIYHRCNDADIKFEVSFPRVDSWNHKEIFDVDKNFGGDFYNTELVSNIFETIEEANNETEKLNEELRNDYCWMITFGNKEKQTK